jgi:hypothetical protein
LSFLIANCPSQRPNDRVGQVIELARGRLALSATAQVFGHQIGNSGRQVAQLERPQIIFADAAQVRHCSANPRSW